LKTGIVFPDCLEFGILAKTSNTISLSKDNEAARRRLSKHITDTLRKPTTRPTKLAKESEMV
jgi:hypothetical protein